MSEYKKEAAVAVSIALVCALGLGLMTIYVFPLQTRSSTPQPIVTQTNSTSRSVIHPTINAKPGLIADACLSSPSVQQYIEYAYSYNFGNVTSSGNLSILFVPVNILTAQEVSGDWTTGYKITFTGIEMLNVTIEVTNSSDYSVIGVTVTNLPDQTQSVSYNTQQQRIIQVAFSNSTVEQLTQNHYYAESVSQIPSMLNETYAGDYSVLLYETNGIQTIDVLVNSSITNVVAIQTITRS